MLGTKTNNTSTQKKKWSKNSDGQFRLDWSLCPPGVSVRVVPAGNRFRVTAVFNRQRFYLINDHDDKPRSYSRSDKAKLAAERYASSAEQVKEIA